MVKKTLSVLMCCVGLIIFVSTLHGQGSKKTITLPSGEIVCDLNGEWDALYVDDHQGKSTDILKITQRDGSFEGVKTIGGRLVPKNAVSIKGELSKGGIAKVQVVMRVFYSGDPVKMIQNMSDGTGQISEDCNKIVIEVAESGEMTIRVTLTRK